MEGNWAVTIMNMIDKITKLIYINVLWVFFVLIGLGLFGFMPATATVNILVRKLMMGEELSGVFKRFWTVYKESFVSSNLVGLLFLIIGIFLYVDINILLGTQSVIGKVVLSLLFMILIMFTATVLHFFPIYARFEMKTFNYIKLSFVIAMSQPITTILMVLWLLVVGILSVQYTVMLPLLFVTMISIGINWLSIKRIEKKNPLSE
ncbi:YesL family protein [Aquibacillus rhizosphaerae]|uniref:DUF624 domain-containing protein n=1 Tax=Aquibacillus rhizosphaerae TaxID=3051431 RepID=A0ABT7KZV3_9BACI|nr:DUF624 domain-containing protein [Aquibacillus sp. LR5S19]MDL4839026.1 DUF624 domain-containing protein [Aquibacillus sp. LR5S19]